MTVKFVILLLVFYLLFRFFKKAPPKLGGKQNRGSVQTSAKGEELVEDPLCHTYVPISNALKWEVDGKTLYFCSRQCLEKYKSAHEKT